MVCRVQLIPNLAGQRDCLAYTEMVVVKCTSALAVTLIRRMTCLLNAELSPTLPLKVPPSAPGMLGTAKFSLEEKLRTDDDEDAFCRIGGR